MKTNKSTLQLRRLVLIVIDKSNAGNIKVDYLSEIQMYKHWVSGAKRKVVNKLLPYKYKPIYTHILNLPLNINITINITISNCTRKDSGIHTLNICQMINLNFYSSLNQRISIKDKNCTQSNAAIDKNKCNCMNNMTGIHVLKIDKPKNNNKNYTPNKATLNNNIGTLNITGTTYKSNSTQNIGTLNNIGTPSNNIGTSSNYNVTPNNSSKSNSNVTLNNNIPNNKGTSSNKVGILNNFGTLYKNSSTRNNIGTPNSNGTPNNNGTPISHSGTPSNNGTPNTYNTIPKKNTTQNNNVTLNNNIPNNNSTSNIIDIINNSDILNISIGIPNNVTFNNNIPNNNGTPNNNNSIPRNIGTPYNNNSTSNNNICIISNFGTSNYKIVIPNNYNGISNNNGTLIPNNNGTSNNNIGILSINISNNGISNNIYILSNIGIPHKNNSKPNNNIGMLNNIDTPNNIGVTHKNDNNYNGTPSNYNGTLNNTGIPNNTIGTLNDIDIPNNNGISNNNNGIPNNIGTSNENIGTLNNYNGKQNNYNVKQNKTGKQNNTGPPNNYDTTNYIIGKPKNNISTLNNNTGKPNEINGTPRNNISTSNKNGISYNYNSTPSNKTLPGPNNSTIYDLRLLLLQSGDIETNPGPNKLKIIRNRKSSKNIITSPNKNNLLLIIVTVVQMLVLLKSLTQHKINTETRAPGNHSMDIKASTIHIIIHRASMIYKQYRLCYWHKRKTKNNYNTHMAVLILLLLLLGGDIELNPGPKPIYPCGICERSVNDTQRAFCCDGCDLWYHKTCLSMCTQDFEYLENRSISYICYKCNVPNHISNLHHIYEIDTINRFSQLSNINDDSLSPTNNTNRIFIPKYHSSPKGISKARMPAKITTTDPTEQNETLTDTEDENYNSLEGNAQKPDEIPDMNKDWRTIVVNANSIRSKQAELEMLIHNLKPDAIIITETKLGNEHNTSEFLPKQLGYEVHRNDKRSDCGGVLIAIKECYNQNEVYNDKTGVVEWVEVNLKDQKKMYIGAFYRQPDRFDNELVKLEASLNKLNEISKNNSNPTIIIGGDFNAGDINWDDNLVESHTTKRFIHEELLRILDFFHLMQHQ